MPSPVGHALAGVAAGWLVVGPAARRDGPAPGRAVWLQALAFGLVGGLPDLDLLVGMHRGPTHGLGSAIVVGLAVLAIAMTGAGARALSPLAGDSPPARIGAARALRLAAAVALAWATHALLDWMGTDTSPPIGIMVLWPFSAEYYESDLHLFMAISRRPWLTGFWVHNLTAVAREVLILAPIVVAVGLLKRRREPGAPTAPGVTRR